MLGEIPLAQQVIETEDSRPSYLEEVVFCL